MKLLIVTQKVDRRDPVLGFMHGWIAAFARECERVTVIALEVGEYDLPENVAVHSLGKESRRSQRRFLSRLVYLVRFYRQIALTRRDYDAVFVHMNHGYVILGGIFWKAWGKIVSLWYAHGAVPLTLRLALHGADVVFTSTQSGFRIPSRKVHVIGQGIDTDRFARAAAPDGERSGEPFRLIVVGRISPVKDYETLLRAVRHLADRGVDCVAEIVGAAPLPEQELYVKKLKDDAARLLIAERIVFRGAVANDEVPALLARADCFVNTSRTGSLDKAMVEAMAAGLPVLTSNESMREVLGGFSNELMFAPGDDHTLAQMIERITAMPLADRRDLGTMLRDLVIRHHDLRHFVRRICETLQLVQR